MYAGRLVAVFGQHLRHTAFAHGVGDAHPQTGQVALRIGKVGVELFIHCVQPPCTAHDDFPLSCQGKTALFTQKNPNIQLLLELRNVVADSRLRERKLRGGAVSAHNDHRVAMSLAVAASACVGETTIDDAECVKKSAPDFWKEYRAMGGSFMIDKEGRQ